MPGPAPKHPSTRARRNNPKNDFRTLPTEGRKGPAPKWPLLPPPIMLATLEAARDRVSTLQAELAESEDGRKRGRLRAALGKQELTVAQVSLQLDQARDAEVELWATLWATPQATAWDDSAAFRREVATYVRFQIMAEQGDLKAASEARQRSDRLGLSPLAMLRLRQQVEETEAAESRGRQRRPQPTPKKGDGEDPRAGLYVVS